MLVISRFVARRISLLLFSTLVCLALPALAFAKTQILANGNDKVSEKLASFVAGKTAWNYH